MRKDIYQKRNLSVCRVSRFVKISSIAGLRAAAAALRSSASICELMTYGGGSDRATTHCTISTLPLWIAWYSSEPRAGYASSRSAIYDATAMLPERMAQFKCVGRIGGGTAVAALDELLEEQRRRHDAQKKTFDDAEARIDAIASRAAAPPLLIGLALQSAEEAELICHALATTKG